MRCRADKADKEGKMEPTPRRFASDEGPVATQVGSAGDDVAAQ